MVNHGESLRNTANHAHRQECLDTHEWWWTIMVPNDLWLLLNSVTVLIQSLLDLPCTIYRAQIMLIGYERYHLVSRRYPTIQQYKLMHGIHVITGTGSIDQGVALPGYAMLRNATHLSIPRHWERHRRKSSEFLGAAEHLGALLGWMNSPSSFCRGFQRLARQVGN